MLLNGESGIVLVAWLLAPEDSLADDLLAVVRQNVGNEANELMWGVPGTLLIARALHTRTREDRWRAAIEESAQALRDERDDDGLWTQRLYGHTSRILGPIHGFVGNIAALDDPHGGADILRHAAVFDGDYAYFTHTGDGIGDPMPIYIVAFDPADLFGAGTEAGPLTIYAELFEAYLEGT